MAICVGDLDDRQMERLRAELIELLARRFAYPPFFDYTAGEARVRPADHAKRQEIESHVRGASFAPLSRMDVSAPEVRRFLEALILRYIETNPALARRFVARRVPELRAWAPKAAVAVQQGLVAHTRGNAPTYGGPQPAPDWAGPKGPSPYATEEDLERNTAVLAATLVRTREGLVATPPTEVATAPAHAAIPVAVPSFQPAQPRPAANYPAPHDTREPTPDTYRMYGEYLDDLNTENMPTVAALPATTPNANGSSGSYGVRESYPSAPAASSPSHGNGFGSSGYNGGSNGGYNARPQMPAPSIPSAAIPSATIISDGFASSAESRQDDMIFRQLRYQLEAYVKRIARSNGLLTIAGGDPTRMVDLLRRSKLVDEADLRLVEGILALTDRVNAQGHATVSDYRQAMMLYLLYHRGHLGE